MSYIDDMNKLARKKQIKESKAMLKKILAIYEDSFLKLSKEWIAILKKNKGQSNASSKLKRMYMLQLYTKILAIQEEYAIKATKNFTQLTYDMFGDMEEFKNLKRYDEFTQLAKDMIDISNADYLKYLYSGSIYKDGKGLSERLWVNVNQDGNKLEDELMSCIAKGMASKDIVKYMHSFVRSGNASYNTMRLARTTYCHMSQIAMMHAPDTNPYIQGIKWNSVHAQGRTCRECEERHGKVYKPEDLPFDHPNGMCYMQAVPMINGKEATPREIAKDLKKWLDGEPNSGMMDKWYNKSRKKVKSVRKA